MATFQRKQLQRQKAKPVVDSRVVLQFLVVMGLVSLVFNIAFFTTVHPTHRDHNDDNKNQTPLGTRDSSSLSIDTALRKSKAHLTGAGRQSGGGDKETGVTEASTDDTTEEDKTKKDNGKPNDNNDDDGKSKVIATFKEAGITLDQESIDQLPTWSQIKQVVGEYPVLYNLDKACPAFRSSVEPVERMIGCSGMFNSGTNLVTQLLKQNCRIPERVAKYGLKGPFHDAQGKPIGPFEAHGMRWQVPWGKHVPANYKEEHATKHATHIAKDGILTAVTIRHPYSWMKSMCKNDYTARWSRGNKCPHLGDEDHDHVPLTIKYDGQVDHHDSLAHLWNDWYAKYWKDADFPYVMVRFEDIIFHPKNVTTQLCECAGGKIIDDQPFQYIVDTAKEGPGHGRLRERTGMVAAWIKYSQPLAPDGGFSGVDYQKSKEFLDQDLMDIFHYRHAPPLGGSGT